MKRVDTKIKILKILELNDFGVTQIALKLKLSNQIIHRYIKDLLANKFILQKGEAPHTVYSLNQEYKYTRIQTDFIFARKKILPSFLKKYIKFNLPDINRADYILDFMLQSSAVYSSNIEGVSIDLNSFINSQKLSKGVQKEVSEVNDLVEAYSLAKLNKLNQKNFLKSHGLLSRHILSKARQGRYRSEGVGVFGQEGLVYSAPEGFLVQNEMRILFEIIDELLVKKMSDAEVVFWSSWLHLEIALIHPFLDGNGRAARLLEKWFLVEKKNETIWSLQTEHYYFQNRPKYYANLRKTDNYWEADFVNFNNFIKLLFDFFLEYK